MLTEVCDYLHNYFERQRYTGTFTVADGALDLSGMVTEGQRFRIIGSAMNDGIYTLQDGSICNDDATEVVYLRPETFTGAICSMGVPAAFLHIVRQIVEWQEKNAEALNSPYTSESFGGYSYTKATGIGANAGGALSWRDIFKSHLNAYRKLC